MKKAKITCHFTCYSSAVQRVKFEQNSNSPSWMPREKKPKLWVNVTFVWFCFHIQQLYTLTSCGFDLIFFWVTLNITFFFSLQRVNGHIGLCRGKTGDSKNSSVEIFSWMRPMGFFLMTSLPSSVRWVLLPCCESSSSQTWWVLVDVLLSRMESKKIPKWSGAARILFTRLTESCAMFSRLLSSSFFHLSLFWKTKIVYVLSWVMILAFHCKIFQKAFGRTVTLHWGEWPATG